MDSEHRQDADATWHWLPANDPNKSKRWYDPNSDFNFSFSAFQHVSLFPRLPMKILLTGICGFAGSVIARGLLEHVSGLQIIGLDNLCRRGSETNLEPLRALGIDIRLGDIRNEDDIASLPRADWVVDCAANPSVLAGVDGKTSAKELLDHNLGGTIHLLEYCRRHGAGFLLLSTSRVYSIKPLADLPVEVRDDAFHPVFALNSQPSSITPAGLTESFPTDPPVSLYGTSKKCSELLALEYGSTFEFPVRINRCGVLAGAGQFGKADQGIFSYWIHSWAARRPLKYIGFGAKGHQVRDCLHPRDLIPLLLKQMTGRPPPEAQETQNRINEGPPSAKDQSRAPDAQIDSSLSSLVPVESPVVSAGRNPREVANQTTPAIVNVSGGANSRMSLAQLSRWCADRFGPHPSFPPAPDLVSSCPPSSKTSESRPFDIPWMVLDSALAKESWNWQPATPIGDVLEEIAQHVGQHPHWLDLVS